MPTFACPQCGTAVDPDRAGEKLGYGCFECGWWVAPVQWFPDDWELLRKLGTGSMGEVFHGRNKTTGEEAALKCVSDARAGNAAFVARFRQEIKILERLDHPGVVRLLRAGVHEGLPWLALELVTGGSLRERMRAEPMSSKEAVRIATELAEALSYLHREGVIHGDLKPENVLMVAGGRAKISDFGLSGLAGAYATGEGPVVSGFTAAYAAPEQLRNAERTQPSADLYSLGRMLFEMLTGRLPNGQESIAQARPGSGRRLDVLLTELLAANPPARPTSAADVKRRLAEIAVDLERMGCSIESSPEGAILELDGRLLGRSPASLPELPEGKHSVRVTAPGFHDRIEEFELLPGRTLKVKVALFALACPHCGEKASNDDAARAHAETCVKAPRAPKPERPKTQPPAVEKSDDTETTGALDGVVTATASLLMGAGKMSPAAIVKLVVVVVVFQLAPLAIARWKYGASLTTLAVAWLALVAFVVLVDRLQRHPGRGE